MNIHEIKQAIEAIAPVETQEEWDNSGVQICYGPVDIKGVMCCMDINNEVIDEAIAKDCNMIVSHHPLIFHPLRSIHGCNGESKYIIRLIQNNIVVYSSHTPFDKADGGNNDYILEGLGCKKFRGLYKTEKESPAIAKIGTLPEAMELRDVAEALNIFLGEPGGIKISGNSSDLIKNIAVCTGAGGEFWEAALDAEADLFISGDIQHHHAIAAKNAGLDIIDAGHYGTEWLFARNMAEKLSSKLKNAVPVYETTARQNPFDVIK